MEIHVNELPPPILPPNILVGVDIEWHGLPDNQLHRPGGKFAALSICTDDVNSYVITDINLVDLALGRIEDCVWCFHKSLFDLVHLRTIREIPPRSRLWDTLLIERILWNGLYNEFSLADCARRYLDIKMDKDLQKSFKIVSELTDEQIEYAAKDAWIGRQVAVEQSMIISPEQFKHWREIDGPCVWAILDFCGMHLDKEKWIALAEKNKEREAAIDATLSFNPRSPKQVKEFFKNELDIKLKTTGVEALEKLKDTTGWEWAEKILESRTYGKRASTYGLKFVEDFAETDEHGQSWIFADFNPIGAETFRMSCRSPNMQNQPARDTLEFRECYTAPLGYKMIVADWKSQEPRITAEITQDPRLKQIFIEGKDVYVVMEELSVSMGYGDPGRKSMKDIFLGMTYGLTEWGYAKRYGVPKKEAAEFLEAGHRMFPVVSDVMEQFGKQRKKVTTLTGRTIWLNPYAQQVENNGRNSPIQSVASDQMKLSIVRLWKQQMKDYGKCFIAAPIHDELVLIVPEELAEKVAKEVEHTMSTVAQEICPSIEFPVDVIICDNWAEGKG